MRKLTTVADWAYDTLYKQEFEITLKGSIHEDKIPELSFVPCTSNSVNMAFILFQLSRIEKRFGRPEHTIIFQGSDPHIDSLPHPFLILKLRSGLIVCGFNYKYCFSLVKDQANIIFEYKVDKSKTNFAARDIYSHVLARVIEEKEDELELEELHRNQIPELSGYYIAYIDSFGNIVTTITREDVKGKVMYGSSVSISINGVKKQAEYRDSIFSAQKGELIIGPGSEGKRDNPFLNLIVKMGPGCNSAYELFRKPLVGSKIEIMM